MARKKNWLKGDSLKCLRKTKSNDFDISWSSSSSDVEETNYKYRKKIKRNDEVDDIDYLKEKGEITPPKRNNCSEDMSPVIGQNLLTLSPILNKTSCDHRNESPVIGSNQKLAELKKHKANRKICSESFNDRFKLLNTQSEEIEQCDISGYSSSGESSKKHMLFMSQFMKCENVNVKHKVQSEKKYSDIDLIESLSESSNDIFSQASAQISIDYSSPTKSQNGFSEISQFSSSQASVNTIISQECSEGSNNSSIHFSSSSSHKPIMYYIVSQKKKKSKKGLLAKQLQKALKNKASNISMWQHEIYLGKIEFCQDILHLRVFQIFVEFACKICLCEFINLEAQEDCNKKCILVLDLPIHHSVKCLQRLKVYKPYSISNVNYCEENFCCYYNVSKILFND